MQGQDPGSRAGRPRRFALTGNCLAALGNARRRARRLLLLAGLAATAACGPEMFHQGVEDAGGNDVPDNSGVGGTGGTGGDDGGSCISGGGGVSGDASVPTFVKSWTFDTATDLIGWTPVGQPPDAVNATTVTLDDQDGFPCAGSARMTIPFTMASSQVALGYTFNTGPQDFSGKVLSARVRINATNGSGTIMAGLAYKSVSGYYLFASSAVPPIVPAQGWVTFSLSFDHPDGYVDTTRTYPDGATIVPDPTQVLEIDVLILTGSAPYMTVDVSIDTVGISDE
jgi:hypothetical protein